MYVYDTSFNSFQLNIFPKWYHMGPPNRTFMDAPHPSTSGSGEESPGCWEEGGLGILAKFQLASPWFDVRIAARKISQRYINWHGQPIVYITIITITITINHQNQSRQYPSEIKHGNWKFPINQGFSSTPCLITGGIYIPWISHQTSIYPAIHIPWTPLNHCKVPLNHYTIPLNPYKIPLKSP